MRVAKLLRVGQKLLIEARSTFSVLGTKIS